MITTSTYSTAKSIAAADSVCEWVEPEPLVNAAPGDVVTAVGAVPVMAIKLTRAPVPFLPCTSCVCAANCAVLKLSLEVEPVGVRDAKAVVNGDEPPVPTVPLIRRNALLLCVVSLVQPVGAV